MCLSRPLFARFTKSLRLVDLIEEAFHETMEQSVRNDSGQDADGRPGTFANDGSGGCQLRESDVEKRFVLLRDGIGSRAESRQ